MSDKEKLWKIYRYWIEFEGKTLNYIGQTSKTRQKRAGNQGYQYLSDGKGHSCRKFADLINQVGGLDKFSYEVLATAKTQEEAWELEKHYIEVFDSYHNGLNATLGGKGSPGTIYSNESRKKMSRKKGFPGILQYDLDRNLINEYSTLMEAHRATGINFGHISEVCHGTRKKAGNFFWELKS